MRAALGLLIVATGWGCGDAGESEDNSDTGALLYVETAGAGGVNGADLGDCGADCVAELSGAGTTLDINSESVGTFLGWSGACESAEGTTCFVPGDIPRDGRYAVATFGPAYARSSRALGDEAVPVSVAAGGTCLVVTAGEFDEPGAVYCVNADASIEWRLPTSPMQSIAAAAGTTGGVVVAATGNSAAFQVGDFHVSDYVSAIAEFDESGVQESGVSLAGNLFLTGVATASHTTAVGFTGGQFFYNGETFPATPAQAVDIAILRGVAGAYTVDVFGGDGRDYALAVAIDESGRDWVLAEFETQTSTSAGLVGPGLAMLVFDDETLVAASTFGGHSFTALQERRQVVATQDGGAVALFRFLGTADVNGTTYVAGDEGAILAVRLDANAQALWAQSWGGPNQPTVGSLAIDGTKVYASSTIRVTPATIGPYEVSPGPVTSNVPVLASFELASGETRWVRRFGAGYQQDGHPRLLLAVHQGELVGVGGVLRGDLGWGGLEETAGIVSGPVLIRYVDDAP